MASLVELAQLSSTAYNPNGESIPGKPLPPHWRAIARTSPSESQSGYFGVAYQNDITNEIVIANRGTEPASLNDWANSLAALVGSTLPQFNSAKEFTQRVINTAVGQGILGYQIVQTGHSLGGGLADMLAVAFGQRSVGFNSIGVKECLNAAGYDANRDYRGTITNISAWFDPAHSVGTRIGSDKQIAVSSIPLVPDLVEPIVATLGAVVFRGVGELNLAAYLKSQHEMNNMVNTLKGLKPNEIRDLVPDLSITSDNQLTGGLASALTSLQIAIANNSDLQEVLASNIFNDQIALTPGAIAAEQDIESTDQRTYSGGADNDLVIGVSGSDRLSGGGGTDVVAGGAGNDMINGGAGNDFLIGGEGHDAYVFNTGDGQDTIIDSDNWNDNPGVLIRNRQKIALGVKSDTNQWRLGGTTYARVGADLKDLEITFADNASDEIAIKNFDFANASADYLGIRLIDAPSAPASPVRTFLGDKQDWDSDPSQTGTQTQNDGFGNTVRADGQGERPDTAEADRADFIYGSDANEVETFQTGGGDDAVFADGLASITSSSGGRDLIETGAGRDVVAAGAGNDWVEGGTGGDILGGNAGDDALYAETSNGQTLTIDQAISSGESGDARSGSGDVLTGDAGDDILISDAGNDLLAGGVGEDVIVGGAGNDLIYGDVSVTSAQLDWSVTRTIGGSGETVSFDINRSNISIAEDAEVGGLDVIYGGAGNDWILAGAGDDSIDGGIGDDVLLGEAGNDAITGGAGNDYVVGDAPSDTGDDFLDGGAGNDQLIGGKGDDILYGGEGDDLLSGGDGNDILYGGPGTDVLGGGTGKDTYVFNRGDGLEVMLDAPAGGADDPEASVLVLGPGISAADVKFRLGSLMIDLGEGDAIHFDGFNPEDPLSTPVLDSIQFADGTQMTYADVLAQGFDLDGTEGDDVITGTAVTDRIDAKGGNDVVIGKAGNDTIAGGAGNDDLDAGAGDDAIDGGAGQDIIDGGDGNDTITTSGGGDIVFGGAGDDAIFAQDGDLIIDLEGTNRLDLTMYSALIAANLEVTQYQAPDGEAYLNLHVRNDLAPGTTPDTGGVSIQRGDLGSFATVTVNDGAGGAVTLGHEELIIQRTGNALVFDGTDAAEMLTGTSYADTFFGGGGADTINAGAGEDRIDGGAGDDTLQGGAGNDTYLLAYNGGRDTVIEDGNAEPNATHTVQLDSGIASTQVRATRTGDALEVRLKATNDALILKDFYTQPQSWRDGWQVRDGNGVSSALETFIPVAPPSAATWIDEEKNAFVARRESVFAANRQGEGYSALGGNSFQRTEQVFSYSSRTSNGSSTTRSLVAQTLASDAASIGVGTAFSSTPLGPTLSAFEIGLPRMRGAGGGRGGVSSGFGRAGGGSGGSSEFVPVQTGFRGLNTSGVKLNPGDYAEPVYGPRFGNARSQLRSGGSLDYANAGNFDNTGQWELVGYNIVRAGHGGGGETGRVSAAATYSNYDQRLTATDVLAGGSDNVIAADTSAIDGGAGDDTITLGAGYFLAGPDWESAFSLGSVNSFSDAEQRYFGREAGLHSFPLLYPDRPNLLGGFAHGGAGADTITGGAGQDVIAGGDGADRLEGGAGSDRFLVGAADSGIDIVSDSGTDPMNYLDWYYWSRGILNWDDHAAHPNEWVVGSDGEGLFYFKTEAAADAELLEVNRFGKGFITALAEAAPVLTRDDPLYGQLVAAGVLSRDVLEFGPGLALADLNITVTVDSFSAQDHPERPWTNGGKVSIRWGVNSGVDLDAPALNWGHEGPDLLHGGWLTSSTDGTWRGYRLGEGIEAFGFADGATLGIDQLLAGATVAVDTGNYVFRANSGYQLIDRRYAAIEFADSIAAGEVQVTRDGVDLLLSSQGAQGRIRNWYADPNAMPVTSLVFQSDPQIDAATLTALGLAEIHGDDGPNTLQGLNGFADVLYGEGGDDFLSGGSGDDDLLGGDGNDTVSGGPGNDFLEGGAGNDTYLFALGDGIDQVFDFDDTPGNVDTLRFASGIAPGDVGVTQDPDSVHLVLNGGADRVVLGGMRSDAGGVIDRVEFADGTVWTPADIAARVALLPATSYNDVFWGTEGNDTVEGLAGEDAFYGNGGNDIFRGGEGNDYAMGGAGNNVIEGGAGDDTLEGFSDGVDLYLPGPGNDVILATSGSIVSFNAGDGDDRINVNSGVAFTLSIGGATAADLRFSVQDGSGILIEIGASDSVWISNLALAPQYRPAVTLQVIGSVHTFDLNAVVEEFLQARSQDPGLAHWSAAQSLEAHLISESDTHAIGGAIAYRYGSTGSIDGLTTAQLQSVLADPGFGETPQDVSVEGENQAPVLTNPIDDQAASEDAAFSFQAPANTFADAGDTLTYTASSSNGDPLPAWLTFNASTRTFGGTPTNDDVGALSLELIATDAGGLSAFDVFGVTVANIDDAPALANAIVDQNATEDAAFSFTVPANSFADVDVGDTLTYSAIQADGSALPSWVTFDAATRTFSGTPANDDVGALSLELIATDAGGLSAFDVFGVTVANTNDAPTLANAIADQAATEDAAFSFTVPANAFADVDLGGTLTYGATKADGSALPAWLTFDTTNRTFGGTPLNADAGVLSLEVTATDVAGTSAFDSFDVTVANTNDAPTLANAIADQAASEDAGFSFTLPANRFADVDAGDTLTYAATRADGSPLPAWLSFDAAARTLSGIPVNADVGAVTVKLTATDASSASAFDSFDVTVANTNDAPTLANAIADQNATEDAAFSFTLPANRFADVDAGDTLTYAATRADGSLLPAWLGFDAVARGFSGTPASGDAGVYSIRVSATDTGSLSASDVFDLSVIGRPAGLTLIGTPNNDILTGAAGDDTLDGRGGSDRLLGDGGNDTFQYFGDAKWTSGFIARNDGSPGNPGTGRTAAIAGKNRSFDVFEGGPGGDVLLGTAGDDAVFLDDRYSAFPGGVRVPRLSGIERIAGGAGNDVIDLTSSDYAYGDVTLEGGAGNDVLWASAGDDTLNGGAGTDTLYGGAGDDLLDGGTGSDSMSGGLGNDTYIVESIGDAVTESAGAGIDTVQSSITYTLGSNVENLMLTGSSAINGRGNALNNVLTGNNANNILNGGAGSDTYLFDSGFGQDTVSDVDPTGIAVDVIRFGAGIDASDVLVARDASSDLFLDVGGAGDGIVLKNWWSGSSNRIERVEFSGGAFLSAAQLEAAATMFVGSAGGDQINGSAGNDFLQGAGGNDVLSDASGGNDVLDGGAGNDKLTGGAGSDLLAGGAGNDTLDTGAGRNVIAFNAGGGVDTVSSAASAENVLSVGGGTGYNDLSLSKNGNDLVVNSGASDKVVLSDWYAGKNNVLDLQVILDASDEFDANSSDPLYNKKVQRFDFLGLVSQFDAALIQSPGLTSWAVTHALLQFHLSGADNAALGGDLAYWYGKNGGFTGIGLAAAQEVIGAPGFGSDAQTLRPFSGLQGGFVKLS